MAHYKAHNGQLQAALLDEQSRVERTKRSANQMQSSMDNREFFLGQQATDDDIRGDFSKLMNDIKTWSTRFTAGHTDTLAEAQFAEYQKICPLYSEPRHLTKVTVNKRNKRLFVRGWTAYVICKQFVRTLDTPNSGKDIWLDSVLADNFQSLEDSLWFAS